MFHVYVCHCYYYCEIPAISKNLVLGDFDGSSFVLLVRESLLEKIP